MGSGEELEAAGTHGSCSQEEERAELLGPVSVSVLFMHVCLWKQKMLSNLLLLQRHELPCECWELSSGSLQEHQVLLTTGPPLQPSPSSLYTVRTTVYEMMLPTFRVVLPTSINLA